MRKDKLEIVDRIGPAEYEFKRSNSSSYWLNMQKKSSINEKLRAIIERHVAEK